MHYIRFLKPPIIDSKQKAKPTVSLLLTITTDLGDAFYPCDISVTVSLDLKKSPSQNATRLLQKSLPWKATDRLIRFSSPVPNWRVSSQDIVSVAVFPDCSQQPALFFSDADPGRQKAQLVMPYVLGAYSEDWPAIQLEAPRTLMRPIPLVTDDQLLICEETGESIARHVWDAGVAAVSCISLLGSARVQSKQGQAFLPSLQHCLEQSPAPSMIELGAGCALVGCAFAKLVPGAVVLLTDVLEAQGVAERNADEIMQPGQGRTPRKPEFLSLDWTEPLPERALRAAPKVIAAADCIYNADYSPTLVTVLDALEKASPGACVLIATKTRHESEAIFLELMQKARFSVLDHEVVLAPLDETPEALEEAEEIDVYVYKRQGRL